MTIAERIAYHRKRAGLSQRQLAAKLDVDASAVGHWEREGGSVPRDIDAVAAALGVTMVQFYSLPRKKKTRAEAA